MLQRCYLLSFKLSGKYGQNSTNNTIGTMKTQMPKPLQKLKNLSKTKLQILCNFQGNYSVTTCQLNSSIAMKTMVLSDKFPNQDAIWQHDKSKKFQKQTLINLVCSKQKITVLYYTSSSSSLSESAAYNTCCC